MPRKSVFKSKRQYTKGLNNQVVALVREHKDVRHLPPPGFIELCLEQPRPKAPDGDQWIHEIKFDGYYITQGKAGADAFAVIRDAMK
jgi:ATP-dependent DNA ligase